MNYSDNNLKDNLFLFNQIINVATNKKAESKTMLSLTHATNLALASGLPKTDTVLEQSALLFAAENP